VSEDWIPNQARDLRSTEEVLTDGGGPVCLRHHRFFYKATSPSFSPPVVPPRTLPLSFSLHPLSRAMSFSGFDVHDGGHALDTDSHAGHGHGHSHGYGFCGSPEGFVHDYMKLRIAAIFVIGVGSLFGALFPILARRSSLITIPKSVFK